MWRKKLSGRKNLIILVSLILVSFALMTFDIRRSQSPTIFETILMWMVSPIQNLVNQSVESAGNVVDHYFFLADVSRENEELKRQINKLISENNQLNEKLRQKARVNELMLHQKQHQLKSTLATVIGRDATQWAKMVFINKGSRDGIRESLAVVTHAGVVGHVIQVGLTTSKVLLIMDGRSAVDALFGEDRISGVVVGTGMEFCEMKYVPITAEVNVGDQVLSSGLGGIYPKGLVVGTVISITKATQGLFQEIIIAPSVDFGRLEEVLVLM
ncbi:MAG: rod shape-determining protein MreC [Nitrospinaceae bacterium]|nr:rod shape-determining protein MreC [Nitrospinaceae bacterium]NIR57323.1 rod shape-determining protein MreC [Nitrospinaceae bacterium]NIS87775.1 rod shape-determining protein MreC [Nitrospinaceae bacterium]NIT84645.1 rod shape-determining protein MreC [Nitrospinaceae bacterium]NIU46824.1 rod shape-determining protein MreC [Nitrospinaceae bacterium]